jgi:Fe-S cluster assembly iron-binding protein IscA
MLPSNNEIKINLTQAAFKQIMLMQQNDYTLDGMIFRLKIGGKGCDGFTYDTGFSKPLDDDIKLHFQFDEQSCELLVDPFTAHYCQSGQLDYMLNPKNNEDGFLFLNDNEENYAGKFFKDENLVPSHLDKN